MILLNLSILLYLSTCNGSPLNPHHQLLPPLQYPESLRKPDFFSSVLGSYFFQYDTGRAPASFRGESRSANGSVSGYYGLVDENNIMRITHYWADANGYRAKTSLRYLKD